MIHSAPGPIPQLSGAAAPHPIMPELPEITAYVEGLERTIQGHPIERIRLRSPSLMRTWDPPLSAAEGLRVTGFRRLGKRIVWVMEGDLFLVFHLMITGRFKWAKRGAAVPSKRGHGAFDFPHGTLLLTEQSTQKRASLHVVRGAGALAELDPGGIDVLSASPSEFAAALRRESRTLKRALTDPSVVSGIGNAHSDEILLFAKLSPLQLTRRLTDEEMARLCDVTRTSLRQWTERLRDEFAGRFPDKITAFHPAMAAHGKYGEPCPACGSPIQRIKYADRETNYCATCQTGGRVLADRGMSRLLGDDWPRTLEELEELRSK
jgi:formamidopyrimidine-DNA glycosylase